MRRFDHVDPLIGAELVRAERGSHLVVEDFRGGSGKRTQARGLEPFEEGRHGDTQGLRSLMHFQGREGVNVHAREGGLHRFADLEVGGAGVLGVDAALHAHLGRPAIPSLAGPAHHLVEPEIVRLAPQVLAELAFGEGAELALEVADIRVVDIAIDHVAHDLARDLTPKFIGGGADVVELFAAHLEEPCDLGLFELVTATCFRHQRGNGRGLR